MNPCSTVADVIVIGTGPLALIEGLHLAQHGRQVTFIDSGEIIGGSWKSLSCLGYDNVEVGVHLIENRYHVNRWMRDILGSRISDQGRQVDFGLVNGRHLSIAFTRVLLHSLVTGKAMLHGRFGASRRSFVSARRAVSQFNSPFLYPDGGFSLLLQTLEKQLQSHDAKFIFGTNVTLLSSRVDGLLINTDRGEIAADKVVMFSRAHAAIDDMPDLLGYIKSSQNHSFVLLLSESAITFKGYIEIIGDRTLKRVRNVGLFARPLPGEGNSLICVQIKHAIGSDQAIAASIHKRLVDIGLLNAKTRLSGFFRDTVTLKTLTQTGARAINNRFAKKIVVHESTDFADCLETRLKTSRDYPSIKSFKRSTN